MSIISNDRNDANETEAIIFKPLINCNILIRLCTKYIYDIGWCIETYIL